MRAPPYIHINEYMYLNDVHILGLGHCCNSFSFTIRLPFSRLGYKEEKDEILKQLITSIINT